MGCPGIDVAKNHLNLAIRHESGEIETRRFENDPKDIDQFKEHLCEIDSERVILLKEVRQECFPGLIWQRCHTEESLGVHFWRNAKGQAPSGYQDETYGVLDQVLERLVLWCKICVFLRASPNRNSRSAISVSIGAK
ncbi:hypothetical protein GGP57_003189 [Salinibacter ruber]|nr:hypothetical protein [Salinibacter ruber]MCS3715370.1 hypothetical protein [Salinibacter ruber]